MIKYASNAMSTIGEYFSLQNIKNKLYNAYNGIVNFIKSPFNSLSSLLGRSENDKASLEQFRADAYSKINDALKDDNADYNALTKGFTKETKQWVNQILKEEIKILGKPPVDFVVVPAGSMARDECGPVTDLEFAILMKKDSVEARKYFMELSQRISDRLFLLGEHPDIGGKGMRLDEADNAPPHVKFGYRNLSKQKQREMLREAVQGRNWDKIPYEGSRPYLATVEDFAKFSKGEFPNEGLSRKQRNDKRRQLFNQAFKTALKKNPVKKGSKAYKDLVQETWFYVDEMTRPYSSREKAIALSAGRKLGRNLTHLYGNKALFDQFKDKRERLLSKVNHNGLTERQQIAYESIQDDITKHLGKQSGLMLKGKLGKKVDLKREMYRLVEQLVTNMGFAVNCPHQNVVDIVKYLEQNKYIDKALSEKLQDFTAFATRLRLKQQMVLQRQGFDVYLDQAAFDEDKADMEEKIQGLHDQKTYFESIGEAQKVADIQRALFKEEVKYDHLLDMAPGKILSKQEEQLLKDKYAPMVSELYLKAREFSEDFKGFLNKDWTKKASAAKKVEASVAITPSLDKQKATPFMPQPAQALASAFPHVQLMTCR